MKSNLRLYLLLASLGVFLQSCDFLFGSREDETVDEVFEQGRIDPNLIPENVGYVPIFPYWEGFDQPRDVYVGYDEMVYVIDNRGVNILDRKGELHRTINIPNAGKVVQSRQMHTYVTGRADVEVGGQMFNLAAVYRIVGASTSGTPEIIDTLIHPFADASRNNTSFRPNDDPQVEFTGVTTLADNTLYVSRKGPRNDLTAISRPDNTILIFNNAGENTGHTSGLNPVTSNLRSVLDVGGIASFAAPPQSLGGFSTSGDFLLVQQSPQAEYKVLWIKRVIDPETGIRFEENANLVQFDFTRADRFLYEPNRFKKPSDVYVATDAQGYIFVVDAQKDSLYQFTRSGAEGVNPPPNSPDTKNIIVSFGGSGNGPFQFNEPSGVCYHRRVVYVADKGNNRIARFKLSTDLE